MRPRSGPRAAGSLGGPARTRRRAVNAGLVVGDPDRPATRGGFTSSRRSDEDDRPPPAAPGDGARGGSSLMVCFASTKAMRGLAVRSDGRAVGGGSPGVESGKRRFPRVSAVSRSARVRSNGSLGSRSWSAERISTRLIESMPRSASSRIVELEHLDGIPGLLRHASSRIVPGSRGRAATAAAGTARSPSARHAAPRNSTISCRVRSVPRCSGRSRRVGQPLLQRGEDLDPLDRVDAQVGVELHARLEHLGRIPGLLRDHLQQRRLDASEAVEPRAGSAAAWRTPRLDALPAEELDDLPEGPERAQVLGLRCAALGQPLLSAERISTRLIESIPRSASSCMPGSSTSAGYPVFSATTSTNAAAAAVGRRSGGDRRDGGSRGGCSWVADRAAGSPSIAEPAGRGTGRVTRTERLRHRRERPARPGPGRSRRGSAAAAVRAATGRSAGSCPGLRGTGDGDRRSARPIRWRATRFSWRAGAPETRRSRPDVATWVWARPARATPGRAHAGGRLAWPFGAGGVVPFGWIHRSIVLGVISWRSGGRGVMGRRAWACVYGPVESRSPSRSGVGLEVGFGAKLAPRP